VGDEAEGGRLEEVVEEEEEEEVEERLKDVRKR